MILLYVLFIISLLIYIIKDRKKTNMYINMIIKQKESNSIKQQKNKEKLKLETNIKSKFNKMKIRESITKVKKEPNKSKFFIQKDDNKKQLNEKKKNKNIIKNKSKIRNKTSIPPKKNRNPLNKRVKGIVIRTRNSFETQTNLKSKKIPNKINLNKKQIQNTFETQTKHVISGLADL